MSFFVLESSTIERACFSVSNVIFFKKGNFQDVSPPLLSFSEGVFGICSNTPESLKGLRIRREDYIAKDKPRR